MEGAEGLNLILVSCSCYLTEPKFQVFLNSLNRIECVFREIHEKRLWGGVKG